ncbi:MAG: dihydropteroate synthase [Alphaproteobacteria bacterium]|nr:dihydropteroate synthase [Alphaproteobacteria bacterium]
MFGIVNITEDSFSDGGRYLNPASAIEHARALVNNGAMAVDLGAAASNPKARPVSPDDEIRRLAPVVKALKQDEIRVSVDTFSPEVQRWAMAQGVAYLNDIEGFADPSFFPELACGSAGLIVMHSVQGRGRATAIDVRPEEIFDRISQFFEQRIGALTSAGIDRSRLILDPGMGFFVGTDPQTSFSVLRQLPALKQAFGMPLLLSVSRKSFLRLTTGRGLPEIGPATLACELFAVMQGADYIRTHDPGALADGLRVLEAATARNRT